MSKREVAAKILDNPLVRGLWRVATPLRNGLRILAYHRIFDSTDSEFPFDEAVISACTEAFYQQMKFVQRNFEVISFADLDECERKGRPFPRRGLIITFDDGYRDNYTHAYPILKQLNLPATIFLVTGHIGSAKLFWWDMVSYCIKHTPLKEKIFHDISHQKMRLIDSRDKAFIIQLILGWIKHVPDDVSRRFVEKLPAELEVDLSNEVGQGVCLAWEEVREMAANRIEFGSHTVTHPILANVSEERLNWEISESKKTIEQQVGKEALVMAYPVGRKTKFSKLAQEAAAHHGFRFAVSYEEGVVLQKNYNRYAMPRVHVETEYTRNLFRANLMFPNLMLSGSQWPHLALEFTENFHLSSKELA
ncbi:MAG: polysaccharide deacetylase family protein [Acidobacteriota bacterium]